MKTLRLIRHNAVNVWFTLLLCMGNAYAALPENVEEVLPEGAAKKERAGDVFIAMISWAVVILAYVLMAGAVVAAAYYLISAFGRAQETKGGYGGFALTAVGVLVMLSIVVALGIIGADWGGDLSNVKVGSK